MKLTKKEIEKELLKYFANIDNIKFAYLFGSQAKEIAGKLSDIDIAVYLDDKLNYDKRFDLRLKLIGDVCGLLKTDNVDLIILNDVDILLSYNVIYFGKVIYCKDELSRIRYEARILSMYFDQQYYYERHTDMTFERIAKEGIL